jgi:hypothetical protein
MMYVKYPLSLRNVEDLLHERGIDLSYETVRYWWNRFGPMGRNAARSLSLPAHNTKASREGIRLVLRPGFQTSVIASAQCPGEVENRTSTDDFARTTAEHLCADAAPQVS